LTINGDSRLFEDSIENNDISTSEYIEIDNIPSNYSADNEFIEFHEISINNNRIALYDGLSKDYETSLLLIESINRDCCLIASITKLLNVNNMNNNLYNETGFLYAIIISTSLLSFIVLIAIFLLIYFFMNGSFKASIPNINNIERIITHDKNDFSKFNSRNKLEISLNSDQNSENLEQSPSSSFSRDTPSAMLTNRSAKEHCLHVMDEKSAQKNSLEPCLSFKERNLLVTDQFDFNLLNWLPSYNEYKSVISEFERFPCSNLISSVIYHETDEHINQNSNNSNNYLVTEMASYYDTQTFV